MTWVRHRTKSLAWTVLAALVLIIGQGVWRYSSGEVTPGEDVVGLVLRVVVVGLLVGVYLRAGGATTATREGLVVHDGVRRRTVPRAEITRWRRTRRATGPWPCCVTAGGWSCPGSGPHRCARCGGRCGPRRDRAPADLCARGRSATGQACSDHSMNSSVCMLPDSSLPSPRVVLTWATRVVRPACSGRATARTTSPSRA